MSNNKKKNTYATYSEKIANKEKKEAYKKEGLKKQRGLLGLKLLAYAILVVVVIMCTMMFSGHFDNAFKWYLPLTGVAMLLLTYKNTKLNKTWSIICYIIGILELLYSAYMIIFK